MINRIKGLIKRSNNIHSLAGNILNAAFSMLLFLSMFRMLSKDVCGRWIIFITAVSLLDLLRLGLTGTGAIRAISTSSNEDQFRYISASYRLTIYSVFVSILLFIPAYFICRPYLSNSYYLPVLLYYPLYALSNIVHFQASNYSQGIVNFKRILIIKTLLASLNCLFVIGYIFFFNKTFIGIVIVTTLSDFVVSIFVFLMKWDGHQYIKRKCKQEILELYHFGKYSIASAIGSNLLRSSDTIIISLSPFLGAQAVAIYAIPLKLIELIEIPLRSLNATALPKLSIAYQQGKEQFGDVMKLYISYSALMLIPAIIIITFFSGILLQFLGGKNYADSLDLQKSILYIISLYIIALPFDRYSGIAMFAFNKPNLNFFKISIMLLINILFDLIAVYAFKSLIMVAIGSVIFIYIGLGLGWHFVKKFGGITLLDSIHATIDTSKILFHQTLNYFKK